MFVSHIDEIESTEVHMEGVKGTSKQVLLGLEEGWKDHVMRLFTLQAGGHTPKHSHPWPHINYIPKGEGVLFLAGKDHPLKPGSVAYVPGGEEHQFRNESDGEFAFICIVPEEGDK